MDNKDVEGAIGWITELLSKIADGVSAFLGMLPDVVIGGIAFVIAVIWLIKKVND
jgi:hypothetical protein